MKGFSKLNLLHIRKRVRKEILIQTKSKCYNQMWQFKSGLIHWLRKFIAFPNLFKIIITSNIIKHFNSWYFATLLTYPQLLSSSETDCWKPWPKYKINWKIEFVIMINLIPCTWILFGELKAFEELNWNFKVKLYLKRLTPLLD